MKQTATHRYFLKGWESNFNHPTNKITVPISPIAHFSDQPHLYDISCKIEELFPYPEETYEGGIVFNTTEHMFMWLKAIYFRDYITAKKILTAASPAAAKLLGRQVKNYDDVKWNEVRYTAMLYANLLKYTDNEYLAKFLLETGERILVEANGKRNINGTLADPIWTVGLYEDDPLILDEANWAGLNLLGKVLMEIRSYLLLFKF